MEFLFFIALMYLCMYFTVLFVGTMFEIKLNKYINFYLSLMTITSIVIITICIKPDVGYDLSRHYETINNIRFFGFDYETQYDNLFIIKALFYFVSLLPYNEFLPAISVIITYSVFLYISINFMGKYHTGFKLLFLAWLINLTLLPFIVPYSGIRTSMAFAIFALGVYKDIIQKKKNIITILCYVIPLFIHPASSILFGLRILFINKNIFNMKLRYVLLLWSLFSFMIINILKEIPLIYISYTAQKLEYYFLNFSGDNRMYFVNLCFLVVLFLLFKWIVRRNISGKQDQVRNLLKFIELVIYFAIGSFYLPSIVGRLLYFIAFFSFPVVYFLMIKSSPRKKIVVILLFSIFIIGNLIYQYVQFTTHGAYISFDFFRID